jgi:prepilin signal peptidase PulO-like enzyme (type II secretory pathway)|tara:strand:+ start:186 stop:959 length:774 start_codon:yes stop_codon:yes gene_type:complete
MGLIFSILLLGLVLGSLANTFIYRIPLSFYPDKKTSSNFKLLGTRSRCTSCEEIIPIYLNIPVVSYLYLKGKCRFCNKPISLIYPIIEISTACIFLLIYLKIGINTFFFFYATFFTLLLISSAIDIRHRILPNSINYILIITGILGSYFFGLINIYDSLIGGASGYLIIFIIEKVYKLIYKKDGIGRGDAKLLSAIGFWFGWLNLPIILFVSSSVGLLFVFIQKFMTKSSDKNILEFKIPFGPFLSLSALFLFLNSS